MNTIYDFTVPAFIKHLGGLKTVLQKSDAFIKEKGMDEKALLASTLYPDMFNFTRQVQVACDTAKGAVARLAGVEIPKKEDTEVTIAELIARIDWTVDFITSVPESAFAEAAERKVTLPYFPNKYMTGFDYAREYAVPNFLFHVVTAYGLVRHAGVPVGKADYMNGLPLKDA
jgi:hypothetical protein